MKYLSLSIGLYLIKSTRSKKSLIAYSLRKKSHI